MRINKIEYKNKIFDNYSVIIDVRTPLEYIEDHIPQSVNFPVIAEAAAICGLTK